jgi:glycosyltransferase involved in cell wall biosynthesis
MTIEQNLVYVPIEPIVERYTESWYRNFPPAFTKAGFNVTVIDGVALSDKIKVGSFLDINSTIHYKCSQLQKIASMFAEGLVKEGTIFFFGDIEFWGLESVRLMADMNKVEVFLTGFCHAASYTTGDAFAIAADYQRYTEIGWFRSLDKIFVGSQYHKEAIINRRLQPLQSTDVVDNIVVSGNPLFRTDYKEFNSKRQPLVVLTNRLDSEKGPLETLALFERAKKAHPDWQFWITSGHAHLKSNSDEVVKKIDQLVASGVIETHLGLTKDEYHEILSKAKVMVSHSLEENFGYCIVEAALYGCLPLLRRGLSHTELVGSQVGGHFMLMDGHEADLTKLETLMGCSVCPKDMASPYFHSLDFIIDHLKEFND